ncbi:hypothetical protein BDV96DRAFT_650718 [Lophiotrema nucula]|uniref:Uncharacterized protein n=1 Tax=Lophiotrema nucula TaxID=690887 RepID=A0A6A5YUD6_9PLEO|nr:hypothetical protein BDV96DRAFT_650718 [Lophiotrema nucula]
MVDDKIVKRQLDELSDAEEDTRPTKAMKIDEYDTLAIAPPASEVSLTLSPVPAEHKSPQAPSVGADELPVKSKGKAKVPSVPPQRIRKDTGAKGASEKPATASVQPILATGHILIPINHTRRRAVQGQKDESVLRVQCRYADTNVGKELCYTKQIHAEIDWNSAQDIASINAWVGQIYTRAGFRKKVVHTWHPDEEAFIELYHNLMIAQAQTKPIEKLTNKRLIEDFNYYFTNRVLKDRNGEDLAPCVKRQEHSISSKLVRLAVNLKNRFEEVWLVTQDAGLHEPYRPHITIELLDEYKTVKESLGLQKNQGLHPDLEKWAVENIAKGNRPATLTNFASSRFQAPVTSSTDNTETSVEDTLLSLSDYIEPNDVQSEHRHASVGSSTAHSESAACTMAIDGDYGTGEEGNEADDEASIGKTGHPGSGPDDEGDQMNQSLNAHNC